MISTIASHYGEWSDVEVSLFHTILSDDSNIIEVGSNIGMHAVPLAKRSPQGKLLCFEPQRIIYQQLCCNLALNNLTNVYAYQMGVGEKAGHVLIESSNYNEAWNYGSFSIDKGFSTEGDFKGEVEKEEIEIITLDEFKPVKKLKSLDLLKIDAEGFDIKVLEGAKKTIAKLKPAIFIECHRHTVDQILEKIDELNYQAYWVISQRYQPNNFNQAVKLNDGYDMNFICYPKRLTKKQKEKTKTLLPILTLATSAAQLDEGEGVRFLSKN